MRRLAGFLILAVLMVGCDSGPQGPGDFSASVRSPGPSVGGVVLDVVGPSIEGFSGAGGSKVLWARQENTNAYRVIVIGEGGGELMFTISVMDRGDGKPKGTVVSAVDLDNRPLPVTKDYKVRISS